MSSWHLFFCSSLGSNIFASSSNDSRIFIWDCSLVNSPIDQTDLDTSGPPELLFVHGGHTERVEDFSWHPTRDWVVASVGAENVVQVWEMNAGIHQPIVPEDQHMFDSIQHILE